MQALQPLERVRRLDAVTQRVEPRHVHDRRHRLLEVEGPLMVAGRLGGEPAEAPHRQPELQGMARQVEQEGRVAAQHLVDRLPQ